MSTKYAISTVHTHSYCPVDGCYRETARSSRYCVRHHRQVHRTGSVSVDERYSDWVSDSAGSSCLICGVSVYAHGLGEFCQLEMRRAVA